MKPCEEGRHDEPRSNGVDLAALIRRLLESVQAPLLAPFLAEWPSAPDRRVPLASELPVLRWLPQIAGGACAFGPDVVAAVCQTAASLAWRQTYTAAQMDAGFLDNYGWSEILGHNGPRMSERIACGFLLLGPSTHYPRHYHEAEEIYLPLSGTAEWQQGDAEWQQRMPGTLIHHAGDEPHAMRTAAAPLLALYLWRSANLAQKARLTGPEIFS
ncbi:MAG TPA: dimethylsulfonioproprionate lyase family protein [Steroidobacteraceae bacterium]